MPFELPVTFMNPSAWSSVMPLTRCSVVPPPPPIRAKSRPWSLLSNGSPPSSFFSLLCLDSLNTLDEVRDHLSDSSRIPNGALPCAGYDVDFRKSPISTKASLITKTSHFKKWNIFMNSNLYPIKIYPRIAITYMVNLVRQNIFLARTSTWSWSLP